jgi:hypothetical protein
MVSNATKAFVVDPLGAAPKSRQALFSPGAEFFSPL